MKNIIIVAGTRPEVVKLAPVVWALRALRADFVFIWSGQHYDYELSGVFFEELGGLRPDYDLGVGSSSHGVQTARVVQGVEEILKKIRGKGIVVAVGDTNTVLGVGLAAVKTGWIFAHVESGLRSFDSYMPEEVNRVVADHVANILFAPSTQAVINLLYEGINPWRVWLVGNTVVDAIKMVMPRVKEGCNRMLAELGIRKPYALVTLHRAENVDHVDRLSNILKGLKEILKEIRLVFPIHPRTKRRIQEFGLADLLDGLNIIKPVGYLEFLALLSNAEMVFADSGGVQEEAFTLGIPCITLRRNTERPETVWYGGNILVGDDPRRIVEAYRYVVKNQEEIVRKIRRVENPYGDGRAGERIANILRRLAEDHEFFMKYSYSKETEPDYRDSDYPTHVIVDGDIFDGMRVEQIHRQCLDMYVTLIYDEKGRPLIPYSDTVIKKSWKLRVWGPRKTVESLLR